MSDYEFVSGWKSDHTIEPELDLLDVYANHRNIVTNLIIKSAPPAGESLCILGAGICFDLDLSKLSREFSSITLLDLKREDVVSGIEYQVKSNGLSREAADKIQINGDCDMTGVYGLLKKANPQSSKQDVDTIAETASKYTPPGFEKYDCIASTCVLSQLLFHVHDTISDEHGSFIELLRTIRQRHLEIIVDALNPLGTGILITDFVSSDSLEELYSTNDLQKTLQDAIASQNYLHGLNPAMVSQVLHQEQFKSKLKSLQVTTPWRWILKEKIYACFAISFSRI